MIFERIDGVPKFEAVEFSEKRNRYCLCIPIINEGERIVSELKRAFSENIHKKVDIIICDGGSTDGSTNYEMLIGLGVNTLLVKQDVGKQAAQLRMGFWWATQRGYEGIITVDGNDKDSIEDTPLFINKLDEGFDFIQGSRYVKGGKAINTPLFRHLLVKLLHAPIISITAGQWFTDTTNAFRGYSIKYLEHPKVKPFRDVFQTYELLAYLSVRASQLRLKACEVPVTRAYPKSGKVPTKISFFKGNWNLFRILIVNLFGGYSCKS